MSEISLADLKELKIATNANLPECKKALMESGNNISKALVLLNRKGMNEIQIAIDMIFEF